MEDLVAEMNRDTTKFWNMVKNQWGSFPRCYEDVHKYEHKTDEMMKKRNTRKGGLDEIRRKSL